MFREEATARTFSTFPSPLDRAAINASNPADPPSNGLLLRLALHPRQTFIILPQRIFGSR